MLQLLDNFLDKITMYRLVQYYLYTLIGIACVLSLFGFIPYSAYSIIVSLTLISGVSLVTNKIFSSVYEAPTNIESVYITAAILTLIMTPITNTADIITLGWVSVIAMASKYILAIGKKHIFNPAAIAPLLTSIVINQSASWWVGSAWIMPFVIIGGMLITRKIRKVDMVFSFLMTVFISVFIIIITNNQNPIDVMTKVLLHSSLFFMAFVMLTEPLTTPPGKISQILYGIITGFLFVPQVHFGSIYSTPELALCFGNIFSFLLSPKTKIILYIKDKIQVAPDIVEFLFVPRTKLNFIAGQYMEWTLPHPHPDSRGNRRYFTIASSPTEDILRLGIKFYPGGSSFKNTMLKMDNKIPVVASGISGDFTLPKDKTKKLVFIAGGIGITPFRSIIKFMLDKDIPKQITLFYSNKEHNEIMYKDVFDEAERKLGIKTFYTLTDINKIPVGWRGLTGRVNASMIQEKVPDYKERLYYLSGPHAMVVAYEKVLETLGIRKNQIKTDFFPGFA